VVGISEAPGVCYVDIILPVCPFNQEYTNIKAEKTKARKAASLNRQQRSPETLPAVFCVSIQQPSLSLICAVDDPRMFSLVFSPSLNPLVISPSIDLAGGLPLPSVRLVLSAEACDRIRTRGHKNAFEPLCF